MTNKKSPYRSSIWEPKKEYRISPSFTTREFDTISRLLAVNVAKMNVPVIAPTDLLKISKLARKLAKKLSKSDKTVQVEKQEIENYLENSRVYLGAGILTVICILAVESGGEYPPMDRYVANGLLSKKKITKTEKMKLLSQSNEKFSDVYVGKVIPAWRRERKKRSPEEIDIFWGEAGKRRLAKKKK